MDPRKLTKLALIIFPLAFIVIFSYSRAYSQVFEKIQREEILTKFYSGEIPFLKNEGQIKDINVAYYAKTLGAGFFITMDGQLAYSFTKSDLGEGLKAWALKESFIGAFPPDIKFEGKSSVIVSQFKGKDPTEWKTKISAYDRLNFGEIYTAVELSLKAYGGGLEKVFYLKPLANVEEIRIQIEGAKSLRTNENGELEVETDLGVIKFSKPMAYQEENGKLNNVEVRYVINGNEYSFSVGEYDRTKALVIAPNVLSTFASSPISEAYPAIDTDGSGNVFIAGATASPDSPTTSGAIDTTRRDSTDVFIAKLDASMNHLLATAFLGGAEWEESYGIAIDEAGNIYIGGATTSADFPTTQGAYSTTYMGGEDAFLSKFDKDLQTLLSSSYFGDSGDDRITSLNVGSKGYVSVGGITTSPYVSALFGTSSNSPSGSPIPFSTTFDNNLTPYIDVQTPVTGKPGSSQSAVDSSSTTAKSDADKQDQLQTEKDKTKDKTKGPLGPGWFLVQPEPITPEKAKAYYEKKRRENAELRATQTPTLNFGIMAAETPSSETLELARALRYNPVLIFNYVYNHIDYVPYFGSVKGATLTYLDGSGNDFDQASLMVSLLRSSGYDAQYVYGTMTIPGGQLANWLGVDQTPAAISTALTKGSIPFNPPQSDGTTTLNRVWVKATIDAVDRFFDPAFKPYSYKNKIDIGQATGYNRDDFMNAAKSGAYLGYGLNYHAKNMNETNVRSKLVTYASSLVDKIRTEHPNSYVNDIIGGRSINQNQFTEIPNIPSNLSPVPAADPWTDIPDEYTTTIRIRHVNIDYTFKTPDLSGKRVTLTYAAGDNRPELRLDGDLKSSGDPTTIGHTYDLTITVSHPYLTPQEVHYPLKSGSNYAIAYNFGGISDTLLQKRQQQLETYRAQGLPDTSESVLGETLHIMAQTWLKEVAMENRLLSSLAETIVITNHNVGIIAQEAGYYIDVKAFIVGITSKHNNELDHLAHFKTLTLIASAFEHGMLEQLMGSDKPAASTIKLLQIANSTWKDVFQVSNLQNFENDIWPQLTGYSSNPSNPDDLTTDRGVFRKAIQDGKTLILPASGQLQLPGWQWKGKGYIAEKFSGGEWIMEMVIAGGYGGYPAYEAPVDIPYVSQTTGYTSTTNINPYTACVQASYKPPSFCGDPVDMASGTSFFEHTDLAMGGNAPLGVSFSRSYRSMLNYNKRSLGNGWTHNYDIYLTPTSHGEPGLGSRQPVDAAGFITALYVCLDLFKTQDSLEGLMDAVLTSKWAIDQLIDNAIKINIGHKVMEYIKLADGTYAPPPGITTQLIKNGDLFSLQERFDTRINFNTDKKVSQIIDIDGNTMTFTYSGSDLIIRDAFNRTLTVHYSGDRISTVSDSAGRSVSYGYTGDDLTSYTDPEGKTWGYGYDSNHWMTTLTNPLSVTMASNVYDSLGHVQSQTQPRQSGDAIYYYYFSGFRNMIEGPLGYKQIFYYDDKGRQFLEEDALGYKVTKEFDGQDHMTKITDPRSYSTNFVYDGNQNLIEIIDPLTKSTKNKYDNQFRLTDTIDPIHHGTHVDYDLRHHPTLSKYGVLYDAGGGSLDNGIFQTGASYYNNGLVNTATDGNGVVTTMTYNPYGSPLTTTTNSHPAINYVYDSIGRMTNLTDQVGSSTRFDYDKRNLLKNKTDPLNKQSTLNYDDAGRLSTQTDRNNNMIGYDYTPSDKLERITYPNGATVNFTYNLLDQLISMQDTLGNTTYMYDLVGRPTFVTNPYNFTVSYTLYDEAGNLKELTYPENKKVTYTYDELNRLKTVKINWLSGTPTATYNYDDAGRLTSVTNFNGTVTTYGYDNANRLISLENRKSDTGIIATYQFPVLDGNGNRKQIIQTEPLTPMIPLGTTSYNYNTQKNRLISAGATNFTYDGEGQLNTGYEPSYTFDYEHRLIGIGSSYQFLYDGSGNRLKAVRNDVVTNYIYDAKGNLLAEADGSNNITRYYIHGLGLLAMVTPSDQLYCYHFNAIGSTIAMTDQTQAIVNKYAYDPFGNIVNQEENLPQPSQPFKFVGQFGVMTEPNGFYYMRARYYDPDVGRFISEDPIGFEGGDVNLMVYVGNDPVDLIDPTGTDVFSFGIGGGWFISESPVGKKGWLSQVGFGIAFDSKTKEFVIYKSSATTRAPLGTVQGGGAGGGFTGGYLKGGMNDFLGESTEKTTYVVIGSNTSIVTSSGKKGFSDSIGGKGFAVGYTNNITATTKALCRF